MKVEYIYDHSKRLWYRHSSTCCGAGLHQVTMLKNNKNLRPLSKEEFIKRRTAEQQKGNWANVPGVVFRDFCNECGQQAGGVWEFKYEDNSPRLNPNKGVSEGQGSLSKSESAGSSPATPAIKERRVI